MAARKKTARRTVLRSSKGKKLYAVRRADGTFSDIQDYARASRADQARTSKAEKSAGRKSAKKKATKKKAARKKVVKKK
jgi:hypothetical protein